MIDSNTRSENGPDCNWKATGDDVPIDRRSGFAKRAVHCTPNNRGGSSICQNISSERRIQVVESSYFRSSDCGDSRGKRNEMSSGDCPFRLVKVR